MEVMFAVMMGMLGLILVSLWAILYQLVKQQGRLLLRQDDVEQRLAQAGIAGAANGAPAQPAGLEVGTPITPFSLPDLEGKPVSLEDFRGKRVLLVHWSSQCGFCDLIAPDLAKLQGDLRKRDVQLLFLSHSDVETDRKLAAEHGLECPILQLKDNPKAQEIFQGQGTPAAYLLDDQGRVAQPLAVGAEQVPALAKEATGRGKRKRLAGERPLSESRLERNGLKAGTPAPTFRLPDVHGRTVALEEYRGKQVLLVFTDPHCGPCDQLAPHLVQMHEEHRNNGLALIMVARGEAEENRRKAEEFGFEFPVVLQERWKLSMEYGIFAAPVAFLIGEDGVIARDVARGVDEILTLAPEGVVAETNGKGVAL